MSGNLFARWLRPLVRPLGIIPKSLACRPESNGRVLAQVTP